MPARSRPSWSSSTPTRSPASSTRVVAVDAGVDHLFRHGGRDARRTSATWSTAPSSPAGRPTCSNTALFVGGSNVAAGEAVLEAVKKTFFGPFPVSVLFDANGSNTTAAAAVLTALQASGGSLAGSSRHGAGRDRSGRPEDRPPARPPGRHGRRRLPRPGSSQRPGQQAP